MGGGVTLYFFSFCELFTNDFSTTRFYKLNIENTMSYVEHGPRIFLAGDSNKKRKNSLSNGEDDRNLNPLVYGDYVLPRKRSDGRLKAYESCTDIRAWSQNPLDNSHYIRELAEHAKTVSSSEALFRFHNSYTAIRCCYI